MASLRDGLGGEELQISGLQVGGVNISPYFTGSITAESFISGLNIFAGASGTFARITNAYGALFPVTMGSPGAFGAIVQAGSADTTAGSAGFIALRQAHANTAYAVVLTPFSGGSIAAFVSGIQNATSGVNFVGGPSNRYYWITVGL